MKRIFLAAVYVLIFSGILFADDSRKLTVVYTNSLNGNIDFCECHDDPKGGLVKRSTEINKIRKEFENVMVFETGDFFPYEKDVLLMKYIVKSYQHIAYDAFMFGDQEFSAGVSEFLNYADSLPFVCGNFAVKTGDSEKTIGKRTMIISRKGMKAGIAGSISKNAFKYYPADTVSSVIVRDQYAELKKDIEELKKQKPDIIILLSHSGLDEDRLIAGAVSGIDLIVGGHSQALIRKPERINNTIIVQAGTNGSNIGILELGLGKDGISIIENSFRLPDDKQPEDDPVIRAYIKEYREENKKAYQKLRFD